MFVQMMIIVDLFTARSNLHLYRFVCGGGGGGGGGGEVEKSFFSICILD